MNLSKEIASMYDDAVRIRQDLHRIPEIGFQLHDTQAYVLNELRQCAPDRLETPAVCGVKAVFFAKDAQKTIALRADMDGIHNDEANDVPYRSQRPGCMHGCGHDGHMTILLLLARWIAKNRAHLHCNVVLLFQPGEEGWRAAHDRRRRARKPAGGLRLRSAPVADRAEGQDRHPLGLSHGADERL